MIGFCAKHLNIEIGLGLRSDRWVGAEYWEKQADTSLTLETIIERSEAIVTGYDGGGLDDLSALVVLGRDRKTKDWLAWVHAWCHHSVLDRRKSIASKLLDFREDGELTIVGDNLDDVSAVVEITSRINDTGLFLGMAVDPSGLGGLVEALAEIDVTVENKLLIGIGQGWRLMNSVKTAERRLVDATLWHNGSKLMSWCVSNVKIEATATAIRATKAHAGDAKVDGFFALLDAVDFMSTNPEPPGSIYDSDERPNGLLVI